MGTRRDLLTMMIAEESQKAPEASSETRRRAALIVTQMIIDGEIGTIDGTTPDNIEEQVAWWLDLLGLNNRSIRLNQPGDRPMRRKTSASWESGPFPLSDSG